ncbi:MAG TPA: MerR family transcriptional regulator [Aquihabitans sp.]|jgi:DNA-binding transcriptional MerR regulator|nr:MerR family transcriptional regulator [Aquihabitans sp.]
MGALTIGRLADAAGVNVETVRYYERRGLLVPPPRTASGYRQYGDADLWRLAFIRRAKALGFTLAEISSLLETDATGARSAERVLATASARLAAVEQQMDDLDRVRARLRSLLATCEQGGDDCTSLRPEPVST